MSNVKPNLMHKCQVASKLVFSSLGKCGSNRGWGAKPVAICRRVAQDALSFTCNPIDGGLADFLGYQSLADTHTLLHSHLQIFYTFISN